MKTDCFIIAEAGVNHNGDPALAFRLVEEAAKAGADAVKFQTFKAESVAAAAAPKAEYQLATTGKKDSQLEMLRKLELPYAAFTDLKKAADKAGIEFMSTAFDLESLDFLVDEVGIGRIKIPSGEVTNGPYLLACARKRLPLIMSSGMCRLDEIALALDVIAWGLTNDQAPSSLDEIRGMGKTKEGRETLAENVTLLHCVSQYPAPFEDLNLRAMDTMEKAFHLPVGYSDHSQGIIASPVAVAQGACMIEKHFTLDKNMEGPDHAASLEPEELREMVANIRVGKSESGPSVQSMLGDGNKAPKSSEIKNIPIIRRSLVAACNIRKGEILTEAMITQKRPGDGISPMYYWDMLGKLAPCDYKADEKLQTQS